MSLQLDGCHQLSDIILWSVLSQVGNSLIQLSLKGAKLLSTQSAVAITQFCPHIEWLSLSGCCKISDQELVTLSQLQLQYLDLSECHKITDNGLEVLATQLARSLHALLLRCFQVNALFSVTKVLLHYSLTLTFKKKRIFFSFNY